MGKVILTADDFGACKFIDDGIYKAIDGGQINTISAFVTHNRSESSIKELVAKRKGMMNNGKYAFNIGLHFSITSGFSLQDKDTSLTVGSPDKPFYFIEAKNYPFHSIDGTDLKNEIIAQLNQLDEWLEEDLIDHVTVHHGVVYLESSLYQLFIETIAAYTNEIKNQKYSGKSIPIRSPQSWFRAKDVPNCCYSPDTGEKQILSEIIVEGFELGYWRRIRETTNSKMQAKKEDANKLGIYCSDYLVDVIYNQSCTEGIDCLLKSISKNDITAEFMLHLGYLQDSENLTDAEFNRLVETEHGINKDYFRKRMIEELKTIEDINLASKLKEFAIQPIFYSDL